MGKIKGDVNEDHIKALDAVARRQAPASAYSPNVNNSQDILPVERQTIPIRISICEAASTPAVSPPDLILLRRWKYVL